jgi:hypothetical protein
MKKTVFTLFLASTLLAAPPSVRASDNPMVDMMRVMMEMFLWMMGGSGRSFGSSPYASGLSNYNNPYLWGMQANPWSSGMWGNGIYNNPGSWGSLYGYNPAYMYGSQYGSGFTSPYTSPYANNYLNGWQNYNRWTTPYSGYGNYYNRYRWPYTNAPVVLQPIIVDPKASDRRKKGKGKKPAVQNSGARPPVDAPRNKQPRSESQKQPAGGGDQRLQGAWQGVNGEYLELGSDNFRMLSGDEYMEGRYMVNNGIMKIQLYTQEEPVYMRINLNGPELLFESEDGQLMLFRRVGPLNNSYSGSVPPPPVANPWR